MVVNDLAILDDVATALHALADRISRGSWAGPIYATSRRLPTDLPIGHFTFGSDDNADPLDAG